MATRAKLQTVEGALSERDTMRIWDAVSKTDPAHTKPVEFGRKFTAIDAHYQIQEATRLFGPIGEGWGYDTGEITFADGLVIIPVTLWHTDRSKTFGPIYGSTTLRDRKGNIDKDAPKKATTDALTKALSQLGFNADVFLGKFDDNKYVEQVTKEFHPKSPNNDGGDATHPRGPGDMSDSALRGCIKTLVHNLHGCGSVADVDELLAVKETQETIEQCKRRFPNWWATGKGMPDEFKPLKMIIDETRAGLLALEETE
jgi:hypothetical protein